LSPQRFISDVYTGNGEGWGKLPPTHLNTRYFLTVAYILTNLLHLVRKWFRRKNAQSGWSRDL